MSISDAHDRVFKALSSSVRRQMLDDLRDQPLTTGTLCAHFPELDRCTVMQHLGVLQRAGLVIARREGRSRWNYLDAGPFKDIYDRWISGYAAEAVELLGRLKRDLEGA